MAEKSKLHIVVAVVSVLLHFEPRALTLAQDQADTFEVVHAWKVIDYEWPSEETRNESLKSGDYVPENNAISGIKLWRDRAYLSVPRWLPGVPSTLNYVPASSSEGDGPNLVPFPSWEMQEMGNCSAIQYVQGMEIDPLGRMWVLDVGRRNILTLTPDNTCHPKLVILDLNDNGKVLHVYEFTDDVAPRLTSFLNDIVVDVNGNPDGSDWFAYMTDSGGVPTLGGGIVVYELAEDKAWRVSDFPSMSADVLSLIVEVGGGPALLSFNVDGIALSPKGVRDPQVYYSALGSKYLYSIPADAIKRLRYLRSLPFVRNYGQKMSESDGMMMDNTGNLYFGLLTKEAVAVVSESTLRQGDGETVGEDVLFSDFEQLQWEDGFGFDNNGSLWFITNRLQNLEASLIIPSYINLSEINYRLIRFHTGTKSYMY